MQKVIFYAPILEYPPAGGPQLSVVNAIKVLHRISELHILTTVPPDRLGSAAAMQFFKDHSHSLVHLPTSRWRAGHPLLDRLLQRLRRAAAPIYAHVDVPRIISYADQHGIDVFWVDRVLEHAFAVFALLRRRLPGARIVGDTCSVYSRFILRELPLVTHPVRRWWIRIKGWRKEREERALTSRADVVTAVSPLDADYFRGIASQPERIMLFSNVVDLADFKPESHPAMELKQPCMLLLGSFGHPNSPMDRAATWMAHDVMPLVLRHVPSAHLYVIGRNADWSQAAVAGDSIEVIGKVPSVVPYLHGAALTLVPLRFESGTRFKILEAGAASVACVSTTLGAEGIHVRDEEDILIADTTEDFAAAIVRLLTDPEEARRLGRRLHDLVARKYSLEVQQLEGQSILGYLGKRDLARTA